MSARGPQTRMPAKQGARPIEGRGTRMAAQRRYAWLAAMVAGLAGAGTAQADSCAAADNVRLVADSKGCLALLPIGGAAAAGGGVLVVILHGDGRGVLRDGAAEDYTTMGRRLAEDGARTVVLMSRPGYQTPFGASSGYANPNDDDYTPANVERVAAAIRRLKEHYRSPRVILIGHSGGAATSALIIARHHGTADAAILLGCPCDVPQWRTHRGGAWKSSLNPLDAAGNVPKKTPIVAITGVNDDNTLPLLAQRYVERAAAAGANARFIAAERHDHKSIVRLRSIAQLVAELTAQLE